MGRAWNVFLPECDQEIGTPYGEQQSGCPAEQRQHDAFSKQLPDDTHTAGAKRRSNRHLFVTAGCTCEQQVRHVRTSDQQYARNGGEKYEQRRTNVFHQRFESWVEPQTFVSVCVWIMLFETRAYRRKVSLRLCFRDAWFKTSHHFQEVRAASACDGRFPGGVTGDRGP